MSSERHLWKWAHYQVERLWHWIYYAKLAPTQTTDKGSYRYSVYYYNKDGTLMEFNGTRHEAVSEPLLPLTPPK